MNKRFAVCLFFILLIFPLAGCISSRYASAPTVLDKQRILQLVNEARTRGCRCGGQRMAPVEPVRWNSQLESAAQQHSNFMRRKNRLSHTGSGFSNVGKRVTQEGYTWFTVGENIAVGQTSEEEVMESWLKSAGHCANIMNPKFKEMGVATAGAYWTQVFAASR